MTQFQTGNRLLPAPRRAVAAVELALLLPLLMMLLIGMWEVGRMIEVQQLLSNAAREGARQAATGELTEAEVEAAVQQYIANQGLTTTNLEVEVWNETRSGSIRDAKNLDELHVTVSIPAADVRWVLLYLATDPESTVNGKAIWTCVKDGEYQDPQDPAIE